MVTQYRVVNSLALIDAAYIAGLIDGEGTITLGRKHAGEKRQLAISISNTEKPLLDFVLRSVGAGKITRKKTSRDLNPRCSGSARTLFRMVSVLLASRLSVFP